MCNSATSKLFNAKVSCAVLLKPCIFHTGIFDFVLKIVCSCLILIINHNVYYQLGTFWTCIDGGLVYHVWTFIIDENVLIRENYFGKKSALSMISWL